MKKSTPLFFHTQFSLFFLLCVLFIPFPLTIFRFQENISNFCFKKLCTVIAENVFGKIPTAGISSDAVLLYILVLILFLLACLLSFPVFKKQPDRVLGLIRKSLVYYLALLLLKYGIDKVTSSQFYSPEPNILHTSFGNMEKDILFWSTLGTSRLYNLLTGGFEMIAGILLLFKRTRVIGLLISLVILAQVVVVNLSFDISVKLYSSFLCLLAVFLLTPYFKRIYSFFILRRHTQLQEEEGTFLTLERPVFKTSMKIFVISLFIMETFCPVEPVLAAPFLHRAFEITEGAASLNTLTIKRFFIHKDGFIIFETDRGQMLDYKLQVDSSAGQLIITGYDLKTTPYDYRYFSATGVIELQDPLHKDQIMRATAINWQDMPALRDNFHWTVEGAGE